ncbi:MAG: zinc ribbon domain-containing protein [Chloroflexi bacterium]|nr:zinc ribbon domain-containing protein [Chloroflexota bacterium]MCL5076443.1 zinc ribbon domain-containing protein [Chloroflexota bacterium]
MPQGLETILQIVAAMIGAYITALWFCLVVWTFRDIQKRTNDVLVQVLATLLVLLFNLPGLLLYIILRPSETLVEAYARSVEEEALLQNIEERQSCPQCKRHVEPDFLICPACQTELKRLCTNCGRLLDLSWKVCPYCAGR